VVAFTAFYERGFGVPSHRFLRSLLQYYGMELHHLTPSGILHIMTFVTLCEAYMGIDPHFSQWNHLFRSRLSQGSDTEAMSYPVPRNRERSLHTCAQDVQITRMTTI
jgi:hypothetical protein